MRLRVMLREREIERLKRLTSFMGECIDFLAYAVNLHSGEAYDRLQEVAVRDEREIGVLHSLLAHYSKAEPMARTGKLAKFRGLPGGYAYEKAFQQRAVQPIAETFGDEPETLVKAAKQLNGVALAFGDASVEIPALPWVPIVYVLWKTGEFPASATTLFDESASRHLPTEDLAVLAELTTSRLQQVQSILETQKAQFRNTKATFNHV
jgi:hypothetical protein